VNPGIPVPPGIEQLTGIRTEDLVGAKTFRQLLPDVLEFLAGADLGGFNLLGYDLPVLWEELHRAGHVLDLKGVRVLDAKVVFHKKQERTLAAAHRFYCGRDLPGAHRAQADAQAAANVLMAQAAQYEDLRTVESLAQFSTQDRRVDLPGKILLNHEDVPVFAFGKYKDVPVREAQDYARWMLRNDFPENTKEVIRGLISGVDQRTLFQENSK
jgi:DNA polymerase-3 subunit epsilon